MCCFCFFFQAEDGIRDIGVTGVQTCALPIFCLRVRLFWQASFQTFGRPPEINHPHIGPKLRIKGTLRDRKSTRLNSSHANISYAVFCLKKKKITTTSEKERGRTRLSHAPATT